MSKKLLALVVLAASPTVTDNIAAGYEVGQQWLNTVSGDTYQMVSDGVWKSTSPSLTPQVSYIDFNNALADPAYLEGRVFWNQQDHALSFHTDVSGTSIQIGQEQVTRIVNKTGSTILNGQVVYVNGAQDNRPTVALAQANLDIADKTLGIATNDIANNAEGYITTSGLVRDINTSTFTAGDRLWLSPSVAGALTNVEPSEPNHKVYVGTALNATTNGMICVKIQHHTTRTELGLATTDSPTFAAMTLTGDLTFSGGSLSTALSGKQPLDSDLTAIAALTTTAYGRSFLTLADETAARNYVGLGTAVSPTFTNLNLTTSITFSTDTNLYRAGANSLKTDDSLTVVGSIIPDQNNGINSGTTAGITRYSGGVTNDGAVIVLGGSTHSTDANKGMLRIGATDVLTWAATGVTITGSGVSTPSATQVLIGNGELKAGGSVSASGFATTGTITWTHNTADILNAGVITNNNTGDYLTFGVAGSNGYGVSGWARSTIFEAVGASAGTGHIVIGSYNGKIRFQVAARVTVGEVATDGVWTFGASAAPGTPAAGSVLIGGGEIKTAGAATFGGKITFGAGSYSSGSAQAYTSATNGLLIIGKAGSSTDLVLTNGSGSTIFDNPTGTVTARFSGLVKAAGSTDEQLRIGQLATIDSYGYQIGRQSAAGSNLGFLVFYGPQVGYGGYAFRNVDNGDLLRIANDGSLFLGTLSVPSLRKRNFGYAGYSATVLGSEVSGVLSNICIGVDPASVSGGSFGGVGNEIFLRRGVTLMQPNAGATDWEKANLTLGTLTCHGPAVFDGSNQYIQINEATVGKWYVQWLNSASSADYYSATYHRVFGTTAPGTPAANYVLIGAGQLKTSGAITAYDTIFATDGTVQTIMSFGASYGTIGTNSNHPLNLLVNGTTVAQFDSSTTAGHTRFLVYDVDNGTLERVTVGAADSGGTGYKVLRIPN